MHHIVSDGWSLGVLRARARRALRGLRAGASRRRCRSCPSSTPTTPLWQRALARGRGARSGSSPTGRSSSRARPRRSSCPTDRPRPPVQTHRGARAALRAAAGALSRRSRALARREGVTLFMTLLAAFDVLLAPLHRAGRHRGRHAHRGPHARRDRGAHRLLRQHAGLRADLSTASRPFRELLARVRETCLGAYAHQDLPFERLVRGARARARPEPLAALPGDVRAAERAARGADACRGRRGCARRGGRAPARRSSICTLALRRGRGRPRRRRSSTPPISSTRRPSSGWSGTSQRCSKASPPTRSARVCELPLLTEAERRQLLVEWNDTAAALPAGRRHPRALRGAGATRDARRAGASSFEGERLTYRELERARQPARPPPARAAASGRSRWSASACERSRRHGRRACSASSRPAAPTCRSTRRTRRAARASCSRTAARRSCSTEARRRRRCPPTAARSVVSTRDGDALAARDRRRRRVAARRRRTSPT